MKKLISIIIRVFIALTPIAAQLRADASLNWDDNIKGVHEVFMYGSYMQGAHDGVSSYQTLRSAAIDHHVQHAALNIWVQALMPAQPTDPLTYVFDGHTYNFSASVVQDLDNRVRDLTSMGIKTTAILMLGKSGTSTSLTGTAPTELYYAAAEAGVNGDNFYAFSMSSTDGQRCFRALIHFLAERYSLESDPLQHGLISGYIIGNEIQGHYHWYNMGSSQLSLQYVAGEYAKAIRATIEEVSSVNAKVRTYISMENYWAQPDNFSGKDFLDYFNNIAGDIGWHVAFHPYCVDGNPASSPWNDSVNSQTSPLDPLPPIRSSFNTPRITIKNIEVLYFYLNQPSFRFNNEVRRIILSEQGVNDDGDRDRQAAAFAYYYTRAARTPNIDALHWMTHQDYVYPHKETEPAVLATWGLLNQSGTPKRSYNIFTAAGSAGWQAAFDSIIEGPSLKNMIGISSWDDITPYVARPVNGSSSLVNLSHRGIVRPGQTLVGGFGISGGTMRVLIRAVGPTLSNYGVTGALPNPKITVYNSNGSIHTVNDNWASAANWAAIQQAASQVYAFPLPEDSLDSAALVDLPSGTYTVAVDSANGGSGIALFEVYQVAALAGAPSLTNLSARGQVEPGSGLGIGSVVINGSGTKGLLIRAVGPGLAQFNVTGCLPNPKITIKSATTGAIIAQNSNWLDAMNKYDTDYYTGRVWAFTGLNDLDAALYVRLYPGSYSVFVESEDSGSGNVIFEIYSTDQ